MKKFVAVIAFIALGFTGRTCVADDNLTWCGLDYSLVKMIGTMDFNKPDEIFPEGLDKWNALFMKEMLVKLEKLDPAMHTDLAAVQARNQKTSYKKQIIREDGTTAEKVTPTDITDDIIASTVKSYELKQTSGIGLVFIMDRLVKAQEQGCFYVVFFDIASRKVLFSERRIEKAGGAGFRNFWFRPIKTVVEKPLAGMYQKAKAAK